VRNGKTVARTTVPGRLITLALPFDLVVDTSSPREAVIVEPANRSVAGLLTLPYLAARDLAFADLLIPSNGRFTQEDLRLLWEAGAELATWRSARLAVPSGDADFGRPKIVGRAPIVHAWRAVGACAHHAAVLSRHWPVFLDRDTRWLPTGVPGGAEDAALTEREAIRRRLLSERDGVRTITHTARSMGAVRYRRSPSLAALALAVIRLAHDSLPADEQSTIRPILSPIVRVERMAAAPGRRDPDFSSWPGPLLEFAGACTQAIADLRSAERGEGVAPFLDTDELYEAWLAVQIRAILNQRMATQEAVAGDALGAWAHGEILYQLFLKPSLGSRGTLLGTESFAPIVAGVLTPDIVLSATRDQRTCVAVFDAKAWAELPPEAALEQSAKYLYGIRRSSDPATVPILASVDLVTCAPAPNLLEEALARVRVTTATPTGGTTSLSSRVNVIVDSLALALGKPSA